MVVNKGLPYKFYCKQYSTTTVVKNKCMFDNTLCTSIPTNNSFLRKKNPQTINIINYFQQIHRVSR